MTITKEFKFIGVHADELEGGVPVAPGDYTGSIKVEGHDEDGSPKGHNQILIDEGLLVEVPDGTAASVAAANEAAMATTTHRAEHKGEDVIKPPRPRARRSTSSKSKDNERTER